MGNVIEKAKSEMKTWRAHNYIPKMAVYFCCCWYYYYLLLLLVSSFCAFFLSMVVRISSSNAETMVSAHQALTFHWLREFLWCVLPPKAPYPQRLRAIVLCRLDTSKRWRNNNWRRWTSSPNCRRSRFLLSLSLSLSLPVIMARERARELSRV